MANTKMKKMTKRLVLDARIRSNYRWYLRRKNDSGTDVIDVVVGNTNMDGVDQAAQVVHDEIVDSLDWSQNLVDAIEGLGDKWGPKYVAKVIRAGIKAGTIQAEAAQLEGVLVEAGRWIGRAVKKRNPKLASLAKK